MVRAHSLRQTLSNARSGVFLEGRLGDVGIALLVIWLAAQLNPGIALFAVTFDPHQRNPPRKRFLQSAATAPEF